MHFSTSPSPLQFIPVRELFRFHLAALISPAQYEEEEVKKRTNFRRAKNWHPVPYDLNLDCRLFLLFAKHLIERALRYLKVSSHTGRQY